MSCCTPAGYRTIFGGQAADRDVRRYRKHGLSGSAAWLRDALAGDGVDGSTVVEVGGGIGALQLELVEAGAARAANIELVQSYEPAARDLIAEHGLTGRIDRRIGDFAAQPELAPAGDIVVMHRVICCYPDADRLMSEACAHARDRVAVTIPRRTWWIRLGFTAMNAWLQLRRIDFRGFVHPPAEVQAAARAQRFELKRATRGRLWQSMVFQRSGVSGLRG
jgi:magnesium-protoporphyrin O-methyltransferase